MPRDIIKEAGRISLTKQFSSDEVDSLFNDAVRLIAQHEVASASLLQRRLSVGYARAARILDQLEEVGVIGVAEGSKPREVLISSYEDYENGAFRKPTVESVEPEPDWKTFRLPDWKLLAKGVSSSLIFGEIGKSHTISPLSFPIGWEKEKLLMTSFIKTPHLILTGNPQSKKMEYVDMILTSLLTFESPESVRLVLLDGAHYLSIYNSIPHLLTPVTSEPDKVVSALRWGQAEMEYRFNIFARSECRDIISYNKQSSDPIMHIVYVITQVDEFISYGEKEIVEILKKLTSMADRAGIHFVLVSDSFASRSIPKEIQENISNVISFKSTWDGSSKPRDVEDLKPHELLFKNDTDNTVTKLNAPLLEEADVHAIVHELKNR